MSISLSCKQYAKPEFCILGVTVPLGGKVYGKVASYSQTHIPSFAFFLFSCGIVSVFPFQGERSPTSTCLNMALSLAT